MRSGSASAPGRPEPGPGRGGAPAGTTGRKRSRRPAGASIHRSGSRRRSVAAACSWVTPKLVKVSRPSVTRSVAPGPGGSARPDPVELRVGGDLAVTGLGLDRGLWARGGFFDLSLDVPALDRHGAAHRAAGAGRGRVRVGLDRGPAETDTGEQTPENHGPFPFRPGGARPGGVLGSVRARGSGTLGDTDARRRVPVRSCPVEWCENTGCPDEDESPTGALSPSVPGDRTKSHHSAGHHPPVPVRRPVRAAGRAARSGSGRRPPRRRGRPRRPGGGPGGRPRPGSGRTGRRRRGRGRPRAPRPR